MEIREIKQDKKQYMDLLLLADKQESMIDIYLDRGSMYVLEDPFVKAEFVAMDEGNGILETKNIETVPAYHRNGYGKVLIDWICSTYKGQFSIIQVGTGDSPLTVPF